MSKLCAHTTLFCNHFTLILLFKPQSRTMCCAQLYRRRSPVSFFQTATLRYARRNGMTTCQLPPDYRFTTYHKPYTTNLMINNDHNIPLPTDGMQHSHPIQRCAGIMNRAVILPSHEYFPNKNIV